MADKPAGGFTGWVDGRLKVMTTTAVETLKDDLINAVKDELHTLKSDLLGEFGKLPGQVENAVVGVFPTQLQPLVRDEMTDVMTGHFDKVLPDLIRDTVGPQLAGLMGPINQILDIVNRITHPFGFAGGNPAGGPTEQR